jgi:membrane protease YdiL (CAAX protease family)
MAEPVNESPRVAAADHLPWARAVALHLLPGTLTMAALLAVTPALVRAGAPPALAYQVAAGLVGIPVMLGVVLWYARRATGRADPWAVIGNRERPPLWVYPAVLVPMLAWAFGLLVANGPLREYLAGGVFAWLPAYLLPDWEPPAPPDRALLLTALVLQLVVDGLAAPAVEELYFRGFLLPRLGYLGAWAPLVNVALFTVQHWWQPYNWAQIFLIMLPLVYLVWWRRSVWISVAMHCAGNSIGAALALAELAG